MLKHFVEFKQGKGVLFHISTIGDSLLILERETFNYHC